MTESRSVMVFDRAPSDWSAYDGVKVGSPQDLRELLEKLISPDHRILEVRGPEGTTLQLGLAPSCGFAQFLETNPNLVGAPRTFAARAQRAGSVDSVEFLIADTPTPIPPTYCLSLEETFRIAEHFFTTGSREPGSIWDSIC